MDNFLNFVYDEWDSVNDVPLPNRLKTYFNQDDRPHTWVLSTEPLRVFHKTIIKNWKLSDVPNNPDKMFYYHVCNRNGYNNRFFAEGILPVDLDVINFIKNNDNLHLIIMNECEFETKQALERLDRIVKFLKLNPKKVWFIHNGEKLLEHKNELKTDINVHTCRSMVISGKSQTNYVNYKQKKDEGNFFLCHNRSPRIHRYGLLCLLKKYEILDADVNWSLVGGYSFNNQKFLFKDIFNIDDVLDLTKEIEYFTSIEIKKSNYEIDYAGLDDRQTQNLPFETKTYENSYFNIVTETNFVSEDIHITEKSFKPFKFFQFPLILASYHHVKYFREAYPELDLFDDVIDHSYDDKENNRDRLFAFIEEIKRIHNNKEFFIDFYEKNSHRFVKNNEILRDFENEYDYEFFKKLSEVNPKTEIELNLVYDNWNEELQEPYDMNCKEIYTDSFLMNRDSFVRSLGFPEEHIRRFPLIDVEKYPNKKFYYFITLTPNQIGEKIKNKILPMPQDVIDCWKNNKNFNIVLANEQEYESFETFKRVHFWTKFNGLNQSQFWISNNNIKLEDYKSELNSEINVYATSKVRTHIALAMMGVMTSLDYTPDKESKLFLCHNRRVRPHRYALLVLLKKEGIIDNVDWSLVNGWDAKHRFLNNPAGLFGELFDFDTINNLMEECIYFLNIEQKKSIYEEQYEWFDDRDNTDYINWGETYETLSYKNSYFNITTETEFDTTEIHVTEKSFKPFVAFQFPLILASPGHIHEIRKRYDFDWFDDVIDHSYDLEKDHKIRLLKFVEEIKKINNNKEFFIEFYKNNKSRFEKNHKLAKNLTYDTSDRDFLKKLTGLYEYEFETGIRIKSKNKETLI